jgi:hypothetical protein
MWLSSGPQRALSEREASFQAMVSIILIASALDTPIIPMSKILDFGAIGNARDQGEQCETRALVLHA